MRVKMLLEGHLPEDSLFLGTKGAVYLSLILVGCQPRLFQRNPHLGREEIEDFIVDHSHVKGVLAEAFEMLPTYRTVLSNILIMTSDFRAHVVEDVFLPGGPSRESCLVADGADEIDVLGCRRSTEPLGVLGSLSCSLN